MKNRSRIAILKQDKKYSRRWWQEQFSRQAGHPVPWALTALQLEYAAEILRGRQLEDWKKVFPTKHRRSPQKGGDPCPHGTCFDVIWANN
jgi:hypothetical protein